MKTLFILGQNQALSLAELQSVIGSDLDISALSSDFLLSNTKVENPGALQNRLGGTIKIATVQGTVGLDEIDDIPPFVASMIESAEGKINFGLSLYWSENSQVWQTLKSRLNQLGLETKKHLKAAGNSVRFISGKEPALSSVIVNMNNLLESGGEFILVPLEDKIVIAKTESVQDFQDWTKRDMEKPKRDPKRGMLPPKLARVMCNLGLGSDISDQTLLDPFCGVGTVLLESLLLNLETVIGCDIDELAIHDIESNLNWFEEEFGIDISGVSLHTSAAAKLRDVIELDSVDVVVTEPYLGPPQQGRITKFHLDEVTEELKELYTKSFRAISEVLKPGGTIVVAFPVFEVEKKKYYLNVINRFKKLGLEVSEPELGCFNNQKTPRGGILYERKGQFVAREILRFVKR